MLKQKIRNRNNNPFNSGILVALAESGGVITHNVSAPIPFGSRVVGFNRFYKAQTAGIEISAVFAVPLHLGLATATDLPNWQWDSFNLCNGIIFPEDEPNITGLGGAKLLEARFFNTGVTKIYRIKQMQEKEDGAPPAMILTLEEVNVLYEDERPDYKRLANLGSSI